MRHKIFFTAILALLVIALLAACTPVATPAPVPAQHTPVPATSTPASPATSFPLTLTDNLGRKVTLASRPQRIVSLAPSNTEILFAVGAGNQVVGVTQFCNYPPEAKTREQIGGFSAKTISIEKIVALKPDLVLSVGKIQQPVIEALEQANIPVVALEPETFDDVFANILAVGRLTGHEEEATKVVTQMKNRVAAVQTRVKDIPADERPTVFWEVWDEPLMTAGPTTFTGQMITLVGATNIFSDVKEQYPQVSAEEVISRNPAVILGPDSHAEALTVDKVRARPGWGDIKAVQEGRIYLIDGDIASRPGPRLADGVEAIAEALYPQK